MGCLCGKNESAPPAYDKLEEFNLKETKAADQKFDKTVIFTITTPKGHFVYKVNSVEELNHAFSLHFRRKIMDIEIDSRLYKWSLVDGCMPQDLYEIIKRDGLFKVKTNYDH